MKTKNISMQIRKSACSMTTIFLFFAGVFMFSPAQAVEVGWQKIIDDGFHYEEKDPRNVNNCSKICSGCVVETPGHCADVCTAEFYCAGPWRSYAGLWGVGNAYLFLSYYGNMPGVSPKVRKGWAVWQWDVATSGKYKVEVFYRPTENRSPDADYYILTLKGLGIADNMEVLGNRVINQTEHGPLHTQGWVTLGQYEYQKGTTAAVGLWAHDDHFSDEADAVRWTLVEKIADEATVVVPTNYLLLQK